MAGPNQLAEFDLIAKYFAPLAAPAGLGLKDDAAILAIPPDHQLVTTVDALVSTVHFLPDDPPATLGWKALAVNVSDLAAKGATPLGFLLTLALPAGTEEAWIAEFADGLGRAAQQWHCPLIGGDTVAMPGPLTLSITAFGTVPSGTMVQRAGAKPGDYLAVTGTIGDGALGLPLAAQWPAFFAETLSNQDRAYLVDRYRRPRPRLALAEPLRRHAHAAMDVSDGLLGDAAKLASASGVALAIEAADVPLSEAARHVLPADQSCLRHVLTGGDDYEILCAVPPDQWAALAAAALAVQVPLTRIGTVGAGEGLTVTHKGVALSFDTLSYTHFR